MNGSAKIQQLALEISARPKNGQHMGMRAGVPHFDRRSVVSQVLIAMANLNFKINAASIFPTACVDRDGAM
jgi:hypothetical protein